MTVDPRAFRDTAGHFVTGVTVIAAGTGREVHGMTANAFTSLSLDPPLILVCIGRKARMGDHLRRAGAFTVNLLRADQIALSRFFAGARDSAGRPPFRFIHEPEGPRLEGALASLGCRLERELDGGDHWIVIGRVEALFRGIEPLDPLVFYRGTYHELRPAGGPAEPKLGEGEGPQLFYDW
jgi:flavin reductase (DIM6/NTAB) family NADH-FMN oxidoreductase RutF